MSTFRERLEAAYQKANGPIVVDRMDFEAGARAALEIAAEQIGVRPDSINMIRRACSDELRALAREIGEEPDAR